MTLTFPRTDIFDHPFAAQKLTLLERQELSRQANGVAIGKSFGSALWAADWTTSTMANDDAVDFEAIMNSLDGVINAFYGHDLRRPYPRAHADGNFDDDAEILSVGDNNKSLALKLLPAGFTLSRGDYLAFDYGAGPSRALHQVMETVVASGGGTTGEFEVRPHFRPGVEEDIPVTLKKPSALFVLVPGSLDPNMQGTMIGTTSFRAIQKI